MGLVIIFGLMNVINMAHGELFLLGAYTVVVVAAGWRRLLARRWSLAPLVVGLVGLVVEELVIRHVYHRFLDTILATWGLSLVHQAGGDRWASARPPNGRCAACIRRRSAVGSHLSGLPPVHHGRRGAGDICSPSGSSSAPASAWRRARSSPTGRWRPASASTPGGSTALTFAFGAALAGLAGAVMAPMMSVDPQMGLGFLIPAFLAILTGGGGLAGTLLGASLVGGIDVHLRQIVVAGRWPRSWCFAMAIVVIRLFPQGLLAGRSRR